MSAKRKASIPKPVAATNGPMMFVAHQEKFSPAEADAPDDDQFSGRNGDLRASSDRDLSGLSVADDPATAALWNYHAALVHPKKATPPGSREQTSPLVGGDRASLGHDSGSVHDETSSSGNKDDEDDDDEESDDKIDTHKYDPERLKAFNMFVRLFVDENLDRIVPISKQPKEKIQAIIDSCTRQFPEFAERARKRIRTYLKSCRRNKRTRDSNGSWEAARPTPAHLTSVQAEQILASACENESHNAKRMRLGLEPVSQPMPLIPGASPVETLARPAMLDHFATQTSTSPTIATIAATGASTGATVTINPAVNMSVNSPFTITPSSDRDNKIHHSISNLTNNNNHMMNNNNTTNASNFTFTNSVTVKKEVLPNSVNVKKEMSPSSITVKKEAVSGVEIIPTHIKSSQSPVSFASTTSSGATMNGTNSVIPTTANGTSPLSTTPTSIYRPNFPQAFHRTTEPDSPSSTGPTDLSMKPSSLKPLLSHKLSGQEMVAVRQLVTGYRESAAFLLRSADELEQLLLSQS